MLHDNSFILGDKKNSLKKNENKMNNLGIKLKSLFSVFIASFMTTSCDKTETPEEDRPNFILIQADDLGLDDLSPDHRCVSLQNRDYILLYRIRSINHGKKWISRQVAKIYNTVTYRFCAFACK